MATGKDNAEFLTEKARFPPKRGQVKVKIAHNFVGMINKVVSKGAESSSKRTPKDGKVIAEETQLPQPKVIADVSQKGGVMSD